MAQASSTRDSPCRSTRSPLSWLWTTWCSPEDGGYDLTTPLYRKIILVLAVIVHMLKYAQMVIGPSNIPKGRPPKLDTSCSPNVELLRIGASMLPAVQKRCARQTRLQTASGAPRQPWRL